MKGSPEETAALIALARSGVRPWHHYSELVEAAGSALAVLNGEVEDADEAVPRLFSLDLLSEAPDLTAIAAEIEGWASEGINVVTVLDSEYPPNLRTIYNRPPFLFVRGTITSEDAHSIAVVGTRHPSEDGLREAESMARSLGRHGYTVVSGLARGVDTAAHNAALLAHVRTVAVVGTGLRRVYPPENERLQSRISLEGAVVSQFWPDSPPSARQFPMRNIVMSGLALATVVVEAGEKSGARMQARFALEHGRPVFLMRSLLTNEWARRYADRPGTHLVDDAGGVLAHMERLTSFDALLA